MLLHNRNRNRNRNHGCDTINSLSSSPQQYNPIRFNPIRFNPIQTKPKQSNSFVPQTAHVMGMVIIERTEGNDDKKEDRTKYNTTQYAHDDYDDDYALRLITYVYFCCSCSCCYPILSSPPQQSNPIKFVRMKFYPTPPPPFSSSSRIPPLPPRAFFFPFFFASLSAGKHHPSSVITSSHRTVMEEATEE